MRPQLRLKSVVAQNQSKNKPNMSKVSEKQKLLGGDPFYDENDDIGLPQSGHAGPQLQFVAGSEAPLSGIEGRIGSAAAGSSGGHVAAVHQPSLHSIDASFLEDVPAAGAASQSAGTSGSHPMSLSFYSSYFEVDTEEILRRLKACVSYGQTKFFEEDLEGKGPDFYGPFWVTTTLIFALAACGNFGSYLSSDDSSTWTYNFAKLSVASFVLYGYMVLLPILVWMFSKYAMKDSMSLSRLACLYGYSLAPFIPAVLLCVIPSNLLRWLFILGAYAVSASFLMRNIRDSLNAGFDDSRRAFVTLTVLLVLHAGLTLFFNMYFFA
jgi:hypothetical protein